MGSPRIAALCLGLIAVASCERAAVPDELSGLWSAGDASCEAGVGIRFTPEAIEAVYDRETQVLFAAPEYDVVDEGDDFRVRIAYELPRRPGGARSVGAHGVIVLARAFDGIAAESHTLVDARTGASRTRIADDPAQNLLTLKPCTLSHPWRTGLRGR